ncbi:hypothetical protein CTA1_10497 [Colletotrichum tanaceti]|uniref:Uncharacterized protein n=1 Tax=Colletotrichum tanaceti TaxID=1306861 RepID=A0A4U6XUN5_9PEZI|nr:hypothetical protein CTA1_10497 [Colletotrichum tanaceti]
MALGLGLAGHLGLAEVLEPLARSSKFDVGRSKTTPTPTTASLRRRPSGACLIPLSLTGPGPGALLAHVVE